MKIYDPDSYRLIEQRGTILTHGGVPVAFEVSDSAWSDLGRMLPATFESIPLEEVQDCGIKIKSHEHITGWVWKGFQQPIRDAVRAGMRDALALNHLRREFGGSENPVVPPAYAGYTALAIVRAIAEYSRQDPTALHTQYLEELVEAKRRGLGTTGEGAETLGTDDGAGDAGGSV